MKFSKSCSTIINWLRKVDNLDTNVENLTINLWILAKEVLTIGYLRIKDKYNYFKYKRK